MIKTYLQQQAANICSQQKVSFQIIAAIIETESSWNPFAVRYEPEYKYVTKNAADFAKKLNITEATEIQTQKMSWGLMQIMHGKARELGFKGLATELVKIENLYWPILLVKKLNEQYHGSSEQIFAAYNHGSAEIVDGKFVNQSYVDKCMEAMSVYAS